MGRNQKVWERYYSYLLLGLAVDRGVNLTPWGVAYDWKFRLDMRRGSISELLRIDRQIVQRRNRAQFATQPFVAPPQFRPREGWRPLTDEDFALLRGVKEDVADGGPGLDWFVQEANGKGQDEAVLCRTIHAWATRLPTHCKEFRARTKGDNVADWTLAGRIPEVASVPVKWTFSESITYPWYAKVEGRDWKLRLNDFPEDWLYTLIVEKQEVGSFNDFPVAWKRPRDL